MYASIPITMPVSIYLQMSHKRNYELSSEEESALTPWEMDTDAESLVSAAAIQYPIQPAPPVTRTITGMAAYASSDEEPIGAVTVSRGAVAGEAVVRGQLAAALPLKVRSEKRKKKSNKEPKKDRKAKKMKKCKDAAPAAPPTVSAEKMVRSLVPAAQPIVQLVPLPTPTPRPTITKPMSPVKPQRKVMEPFPEKYFSEETRQELE